MKRDFCERCGKQIYTSAAEALVRSDTARLGTMRGVSGKDGKHGRVLVTTQLRITRDGSSNPVQAYVCHDCKRKMLHLAVLASPMLREFAQEILDASEPAAPIDETGFPDPKLREVEEAE